MNTPSWDDLRGLMERGDESCVSIFMSTHRSGREIQQDPLRLKNLLARAENELRTSGLRGPDAAFVLEPGGELLSDGDFWRHQQDGLALFLAPGWWRAISTPIALDESVVVGTRFRIRPLMPALWPDLQFNILALSRHGARLLAATRFGVEEIEVHDMPAGMDDVHSVVEGERQVQARGAARRDPRRRVRRLPRSRAGSRRRRRTADRILPRCGPQRRGGRRHERGAPRGRRGRALPTALPGDDGPPVGHRWGGAGQPG